MSASAGPGAPPVEDIIDLAPDEYIDFMDAELDRLMDDDGDQKQPTPLPVSHFMFCVVCALFSLLFVLASDVFELLISYFWQNSVLRLLIVSDICANVRLFE